MRSILLPCTRKSCVTLQTQLLRKFIDSKLCDFRWYNSTTGEKEYCRYIGRRGREDRAYRTGEREERAGEQSPSENKKE